MAACLLPKTVSHRTNDCVLPKVTHVIDMSTSRSEYFSYFGAIESVYSITTLDLYKIIPRDMHVFSSPLKDIAITDMAAFSSNLKLKGKWSAPVSRTTLSLRRSTLSIPMFALNLFKSRVIPRDGLCGSPKLWPQCRMAVFSKPEKTTKMICVDISSMIYAFDSSSSKGLSAIVRSLQIQVLYKPYFSS